MRVYRVSVIYLYIMWSCVIVNIEIETPSLPLISADALPSSGRAALLALFGQIRLPHQQLRAPRADSERCFPLARAKLSACFQEAGSLHQMKLDITSKPNPPAFHRQRCTPGTLRAASANPPTASGAARRF